MARMLVATQPWGVLWEKQGDRTLKVPTAGQLASIATTVYTASTGGTTISAAAFISDDLGQLPGYVEEGGPYSFDRGDGVPVEVHAVSGGVPGRVADLEDGSAWTGATAGDVLTYGTPPTWAPLSGGNADVAVIKEAPYNLLLPATGITADGTADDTAEINAILAAAQPGHEYLFATPPTGGHYRISGVPLDVPDVRGVALIGESWHNSEIRQYTNNVPIVRSHGQFQRQRRFEDLKLAYNTEQATANTLATALELRSDAVTPSFYFSTLKRLWFYNTRMGVGINSPGQQFAVWNCDFDELLFENTSYCMMDLRPPVAAGCPVNNFKQIKALNNLSAYKASVGIALRLFGEVQMSGLDIEDWYDCVVEAQSGNVKIEGVHLERHTMVTAFVPMFQFANGTFTADQVNLGGVALPGAHYVFQGVGADLNIGAVELVATTGAGQIALAQGDAASSITARTPRLGAGVTMPIAYAGVGNGERVLRSLDGGLAPWNGYYALPAASAAYRGRQFFVQNGVAGGAGAGLADVVRTCVLNADGTTYSWV